MKTRVMVAATVLSTVGILLCGCVSDQKYNEAQMQAHALGMDRDKLAAENADLSAKLAGVRKESDTLSDQVVLLKEQLKASQGKTTAAEQKAASLQGQIDEKDAQIKVLNTKAEELNSEIEKLRTENEELKSKLAPTPETGTEAAPAPGGE